jgi:PAS domain S-box-containing protein
VDTHEAWWAKLRSRAEGRLGRASSAGASKGELDAKRLLHELWVHQSELEMQNEEIRAAQLEIARSCDRYRRLYDLAPVGYVTLDRSGRVRESNIAAATMIGGGRANLLGQPLQKFMPEPAADTFHRHLRAVFAGKGSHSCRVEFERRGTEQTHPLPVRIESTTVPGEDGNGMQCLSVLINLAEIDEER